MKILIPIFSLLALWSNSYGQDGTDTYYFKVDRIDSSFTGQYVQFDFFRRSFGGRIIDTVTINIDNRPIRFIEFRSDDGYNNWFVGQYLKSIDKIDDQAVRVSKCRLDSITTNSFFVTMYLDFYGSDKRKIDGRSRQVQYSFDKKDITEVLVKFGNR